MVSFTTHCSGYFLSFITTVFTKSLRATKSKVTYTISLLASGSALASRRHCLTPLKSSRLTMLMACTMPLSSRGISITTTVPPICVYLWLKSQPQPEKQTEKQRGLTCRSERGVERASFLRENGTRGLHSKGKREPRQQGCPRGNTNP